MGARAPAARSVDGSALRLRRLRGRMIALTALLVAVGGIAIVGLVTLGGGSRRGSSAADHRSGPSLTAPRPPTNRSQAAKRSTPTTAAAASPRTAANQPAAARLQLTGHREMLAGNYQNAIPILRQAVSSAPPGSVIYAYALYDLGRSLMLGGDPRGAVRVLQLRLRIPNQTAVVQQLLEQAERAAGQVPPSSPAPTTSTSATTLTTPTSPSGGRGPGHSGEGGPGFDRGGPTGGAGLAPPTSGHGHGSGVHGNLID